MTTLEIIAEIRGMRRAAEIAATHIKHHPVQQKILCPEAIRDEILEAVDQLERTIPNETNIFMDNKGER